MKLLVGEQKALKKSILKGGKTMNSLKHNQRVTSTLSQKEEQKMNLPAEDQKVITIYEAFRELMKTFEKFIYLKFKDRYIASLYTLLSYCFHQMDAVPYVYLYGIPGSGKEVVFKLFTILGFNTTYVVRLSDAVIKRLISQRQGIFLLDEADILARSQGNFLLSILLNGYKAGGNVYICDKNGDGAIAYPVFGPKIFATYHWINNPALLSRSFVFRMEVPDPKNRPQKLMLAKHGEALKLFAERIAKLFETTEVRDLIMEAYKNLEEIEGVWGRDDELFSGMRAISKVIDEEKGRDILHPLLVKIAQKYVEDRKEQQLFEDRDTQIIAAVAAFMEPRKEHYDEESFTVGEEIRDYVAEQLHLPSSFRTEDFGRILKNRFLLNGTSKVRWVYWKDHKVQKTTYQIDVSRLDKLMMEHEKFIDPSPPVIPESYVPRDIFVGPRFKKWPLPKMWQRR